MTTKEKLIRSAIILFSEKGFEGTSTTAICTHAGFSSAALFVHFKTKNDLLDFIYLKIKKEYFEAAGRGINMSADIFEICEKSMFQGAEYYVEHPENFIFIKRFINSPHLSRITQDEIEKEMAPMMRLLDIGKSKGKIVSLDNSIIFEILTGAFYGYIEHIIKNNHAITLEHIRIILTMIKL